MSRYYAQLQHGQWAVMRDGSNTPLAICSERSNAVFLVNLTNVNANLLAALKNVVALHPDIVNAGSRPIGEPGSVARIEQEFAAQLVSEAHAAIAQAVQS